MSKKSKRRRTKTPGTGEPPGERARRPWEIAAVSLFLAGMVFVVFGRTAHYAFISYDDPAYVYKNPVVVKGLSLAGVRWAFTHVHAANWHPLTTLSHMLDAQVYGLWAGGHHLTNVLLHAIGTVLLFLMLRELTGAFWRCAFVAALFAIHPLRVESVAWVAERKDVLSGIFFMLTLWTYARYARRQESGRPATPLYALVVLWLALGLISKPMLVTTPFILFLLDFWPLQRLREALQWSGLLREKLPLLALSALSCVATTIAQKGAIASWENVPLPVRLENAVIAYGIYIGKLIYPANLAVLYPLPMNGWPPWQVATTLLLLVGCTAGAFFLRRRQPFLLVGWLWYLGMLVPVIGIMQVGSQAYADRYTYLPEIGLCLAGTWAVANWTRQLQPRQWALGGVAATVLGSLLIVACRQTNYWRDSITLWTHTVACTPDNYIARYSLGYLFFESGRVDEAIAQYRAALRINPADADSLNNLGLALQQKGQMKEAIADYREALRLRPGYAEAHYNLGNALLQQNDADTAIAEYREALRIDPANPKVHFNLGNALRRQGRVEEAVAQYREALRSDPADAIIHTNLGVACLQQGRVEESISEFEEALRINPASAEADYDLGTIYLQQGRTGEAIARYSEALRINPAFAEARQNLARILATAPEKSLRNGTRALALAIRASEASGGNNPNILGTVAAAYAETGRFAEAVQTAQQALQLAEAQSNPALASELRRVIELYQANESYHQ